MGKNPITAICASDESSGFCSTGNKGVKSPLPATGRALAPATAISQPLSTMPPMVTKLAGSMKTPEPIIGPATIKVAGTSPILRSELLTIENTFPRD